AVMRNVEQSTSRLEFRARAARGTLSPAPRTPSPAGRERVGVRALVPVASALGIALLLAFGAVSSAEAQSKGAAGGRKPKVIQLEEITIEGRVQKPNAFYILNRS